MSRTIDLAGRVALITGGGAGLGVTIASTLAEAGDRKSTRLNSSHT